MDIRGFARQRPLSTPLCWEPHPHAKYSIMAVQSTALHRPYPETRAEANRHLCRYGLCAAAAPDKSQQVKPEQRREAGYDNHHQVWRVHDTKAKQAAQAGHCGNCQ